MQSTPELISIDAGGSIRIWDMRSYACNQVVDHENIVFNATCFDYVSDYLVTSDNVWRVWRFSNISEDMTEWPVVSDRYNDTFQTFVVASSHGKITIWSAATGELTSAFNASRETELVSMQLHPYGRQILMGFQDGTILLMNYTTGGVVKCFKACDYEITQVFYLSRTEIAICTPEAKIRVYETEDIPDNPVDDGICEAAKEWKCMLPEITCHAYRYDCGQIIVSGQSSFEVWKIGGLMVLHRDQVSGHDYTACCLAENVGFFAISNINSEIELWDLRRYTLCYTIKLSPRPNIQIMLYCPSTQQIVTNGIEDTLVSIWDIAAMVEADATTTNRAKLQSRSLRVSKKLLHSNESSDFFLTSNPSEIEESTNFTPNKRQQTVIVEEPVELCDARFQVGDEPLTSLSLAPRPAALIAGSFDGRVRLLSLEGECYGVLSQSKKATWTYPMDVQQTLMEQTIEAQKTLRMCDRIISPEVVRNSTEAKAEPPSAEESQKEWKAEMEELSPFFHDYRQSVDNAAVVRPFFLPKQKTSSAKDIIMAKALELLEKKDGRLTASPLTRSTPSPTIIQQARQTLEPTVRDKSPSYIPSRAQSETPTKWHSKSKSSSRMSDVTAPSPKSTAITRFPPIRRKNSL
eukprot:TRINITY_DN4371_c0_g1_i11.p1 TRINITY_DN4371_c0_g1~~TRINITY_DN4371_c0_g1_i11.p1  ORF type:complete len:633 (-),score=125.89 TRINITY_DN4371_c0_g1_i11:323-2221(-)